MNSLSYKTISINNQTRSKEWLIVDVSNQILGRAASRIAKLIRGKHKPNYTPHVDCGDNIIVVNASKVKLTGKKWDEKKYIRYSGYPGGQKEIRAIDLLKKDSRRLIKNAVKGMLPKNKLGSKLLSNLYVYSNESHDKEAQAPKEIKLNKIK